MQLENILKIIKNGEKSTTEFKLCDINLPKSIYETICSFLNTKGGTILLGVDDDGKIVGVNKESIFDIKKNFANNINNPEIINPTVLLEVEEIEIENKTILLIQVPESSQVHKYKHKIYIRNHEGDYNITNNQNTVFNLYLTKKCIYTENKVFPNINIKDLRSDIIDRVRKMAVSRNKEHPWALLNDIELIKSASLYSIDPETKEEGFTLACILLFGKDEIIHSVLPQFRTDLVLRVVNEDRYDDRDDMTTNLIETYDRFMSFVKKNLPDPFYLEKDIRINIRDIIFREVATNILIHTEYRSPFPQRFIIERNKIFTENGNRAVYSKIIDPKQLIPDPKNPNIARVFKEIGLVEELGSGTRKLFKYGKAYGGSDPILNDGDIFKFTLPVDIFDYKGHPTRYPTRHSTRTLQDKILEFCKEAKSSKEIMEFLNLKDKANFKNKYLKPLINSNKVSLTIPDKPTSRYQKYITVAIISKN